MQITTRQLLQSVDVKKKKEPSGPFKSSGRGISRQVERWLMMPLVYHLPHCIWPVGPTVTLFFAFGFTSAGLLIAEEPTSMGSVPLGWWFLFFAISVGLVILVGSMASAAYWLFERTLYATKAYYYLHGTANELTIFVASGVDILPAYFLLNYDSRDIDSLWQFYLMRTLICLCILFGLGLVVKVLVRYMVVRLTKSTLWSVVATAMEREVVIRKLVRPFKGRVRDVGDEGRPDASVSELIRSWKQVRLEEPFGLGWAPSSLKSKSLIKVTEDLLQEQAANLIANVTGSDHPDKTFDRGDLNKACGDRIRDIALKMFFPGDQEFIGRRDVVEILRDHYDSRVALKNSLNDRHDISKNLSRTIRIAYYVVTAIIMVALVFQVSLQSLLLPFSTLLIAYSFMFGRTLQRMLEAFVLTVVVRPYNIGDRVVLEGVPDRMAIIVSKINLLTTEAFSTDGQKWIIPNHRAVDMLITQQQKSRNYAVTFNFHVPFRSFTQDVYKRFRDKLQAFFENDSAPWNCNPANWTLLITNVENMNKVILNVWVQLLGINWSSPKKYSVPRMNLYFAIREICEVLGLEYEMPPQPLLLNACGVLNPVPDADVRDCDTSLHGVSQRVKNSVARIGSDSDSSDDDDGYDDDKAHIYSKTSAAKAPAAKMQSLVDADDVADLVVMPRSKAIPRLRRRKSNSKMHISRDGVESSGSDDTTEHADAGAK
jgi:small-conductance mechanosensitive channel